MKLFKIIIAIASYLHSIAPQTQDFIEIFKSKEIDLGEAYKTATKHEIKKESLNDVTTNEKD